MKRRHREPSERNRKIWMAARIERRGQEEIASQYGISQPRVSQIVRRMAAWYAEQSPEVLELSDLAARGRLAEIEYREQIELCLTAAADALRRSQQPLVTKKSRKTKTVEGDVVVREVAVEETVTREQPLSTRAITLMGKCSRELWELAAGGRDRRVGQARGNRVDVGTNPTASADPPESTLAPAHDPDDPIKSYEIRMEQGRQAAVRRLELVRDGILTLDEAEYWSYCDAISDGYVYPSYYEKNTDGITFKVAAWVRNHVPPGVLHGPERQPVWTCHDIPDWDAWSSDDEAARLAVRAACLARWEAWRASVGAPARRGNPNHVNSEFWVWHAEPQAAASAGTAEPAEHERVGWVERAAVDVADGPTPPASEDPRGDEPTPTQDADAAWVGARDDANLPGEVSWRELDPPYALPSPPTAIERLLASGRRLPRRTRDRLTGLAQRRRAAANHGEVFLTAASEDVNTSLECTGASTWPTDSSP